MVTHRHAPSTLTSTHALAVAIQRRDCWIHQCSPCPRPAAKSFDNTDTDACAHSTVQTKIFLMLNLKEKCLKIVAPRPVVRAAVAARVTHPKMVMFDRSSTRFPAPPRTARPDARRTGSHTPHQPLSARRRNRCTARPRGRALPSSPSSDRGASTDRSPGAGADRRVPRRLLARSDLPPSKHKSTDYSICASKHTPRSFQCRAGTSVLSSRRKMRYLSFRRGYLYTAQS